jgi:hypothetical protein
MKYLLDTDHLSILEHSMQRFFALVASVLVASHVTPANFARAEESTRSIAATDASVRSDPPELKATATRIAFGTLVDVVEERTESGKAFVKVKQHDGTMQVLGWIAKSNLGSVKEFDPAMKPDDAVAVDQLTGIDLLMACTYNARGKYLKEKAAEIGVNGSALAAVLKVESSGRGFGNDGRTIIRFENHIFRSQWGSAHAETFDKHFKFEAKEKWKGHQWRKDETAAWETCHKSQAVEWEVMTFARTLDEVAALKSASYGAGQIMGYHFKTIGYADVQSMVKKLDEGIKPQLDAIVAFIKSNELCLNGLKTNDYVMFAKGYNGAGKAVDYGGKIQGGIAAYKKVTAGKQCAD